MGALQTTQRVRRTLGGWLIAGTTVLGCGVEARSEVLWQEDFEDLKYGIDYAGWDNTLAGAPYCNLVTELDSGRPETPQVGFRALRLSNISVMKHLPVQTDALRVQYDFRIGWGGPITKGRFRNGVLEGYDISSPGPGDFCVNEGYEGIDDGAYYMKIYSSEPRYKIADRPLGWYHMDRVVDIANRREIMYITSFGAGEGAVFRHEFIDPSQSVRVVKFSVFNNYSVLIDNIKIESVPEATTAALLGLGIGLGATRRKTPSRHDG